MRSLNRKIQAGPEPLEAVETVAVSSLPDTFREVFRKRPHDVGPPPPEDSRGTPLPQVPAASADDPGVVAEAAAPAADEEGRS